jgi:hypothetical protein
MLWDPSRADTAERSGQNITGFLARNMSLAEREMRMEILHNCGYNVSNAKVIFDRVVAQGGRWNVAWSKSDSAALEKYLKEGYGEGGGWAKDFTRLSKKLQRPPGECMVQYYLWKSRSRAYLALKKKWKSHSVLNDPSWRHRMPNDDCVVCDDGGNLILCDRCDDAYHPQCLSPPLRDLPSGEWYCPDCIVKIGTMEAVRIPAAHDLRSPTSHARSLVASIMTPSRQSHRGSRLDADDQATSNRSRDERSTGTLSSALAANGSASFGSQKSTGELTDSAFDSDASIMSDADDDDL